MLLGTLRDQVLHANREIARLGLAPHTFGNASGIDRTGAEPLVVIKPSGVDYAALTPADLVVTNLDGEIVEGTLRPSSDLDTHTYLYREFPSIGGVVHTHSEFATSWAQAARPIPCLGTTHADYFHGPVPVTDALKRSPKPTCAIPAPSSSADSALKRSTLLPSQGSWLQATPHSCGEHRRPMRSRSRMFLNTLRALLFALSCFAPEPTSHCRPILQFRCTFPNTTTTGSTAQKPPTDSFEGSNPDRLAPQIPGIRRSKTIELLYLCAITRIAS